MPIMVAAVALLTPVPATASEFARSFRLNESLTDAIRNVSYLLSVPVLVLLAGAGALTGVVPASSAVLEASGMLRMLNSL